LRSGGSSSGGGRATCQWRQGPAALTSSGGSAAAAELQAAQRAALWAIASWAMFQQQQGSRQQCGDAAEQLEALERRAPPVHCCAAARGFGLQGSLLLMTMIVALAGILMICVKHPFGSPFFDQCSCSGSGWRQQAARRGAESGQLPSTVVDVRATWCRAPAPFTPPLEISLVAACAMRDGARELYTTRRDDPRQLG
jgi:hypothetical protein